MLPGNPISLWIVVPVYGNWEDTYECVRQLEAQDTEGFHYLIADDGSPQPGPVPIETVNNRHYLHGENLGFAGNCNRGVEYALERGATHVLLLNNDTEFGGDFARAWLGALERHAVDIATPHVHWHSRPGDVWFSGGWKDIWAPFFRLDRTYSEVSRVELVCGCCLMITAGTWRNLGGFDTLFRMYFEDFDFCLRAAELGVPVHVLPEKDLRVWHKVGGSSRATGIWSLHYPLLQTRLFFIRRHYGGWMKAAALLLTGAHLGAILVMNLPQLPKAGRLWDAVLSGLTKDVTRRQSFTRV
jgi:GT2 family glycosyltransferase